MAIVSKVSKTFNADITFDSTLTLLRRLLTEAALVQPDGDGGQAWSCNIATVTL